MGLLDRAVSEEFLPSLPVNGENPPFPERMALLEGASCFLKWIISAWQTPQAVLLSYEKRSDSFVPVETADFDVTSRRKMIIERSTLADWLQGDLSFQLFDKSLYSPYFSSRERGLSHSLLGLACRREEELFALVLVLLKEDDRRILDRRDLAVLENRDIMNRLYKSLFPSESSEKKSTERLEGEELSRRILTEGENRVLLKLNITSLLEQGTPSDSLKEDHQKKEEVLSLFRAFFNERVTLLSDRKNNLYILQPRELFPGLKLMESQLYLGFKELLGEGITPDSIRLNQLESLQDRKSLSSFLED
ncbi:MAG: hypothetical protein PQJ60_13280 [Spirochaetales bacterium]|nr:hypothetical protein [Spirochaetales bacterium]